MLPLTIPVVLIRIKGELSARRGTYRPSQSLMFGFTIPLQNAVVLAPAARLVGLTPSKGAVDGDTAKAWLKVRRLKVLLLKRRKLYVPGAKKGGIEKAILPVAPPSVFRRAMGAMSGPSTA